MSPEGKVRVMVKSQRVPSRTVEVRQPLFSASGVYLGTQSSRIVLYDESLGRENRRTIEEAQKLACNLDLDLEVVERRRYSIVGWLQSLISRTREDYPSVVVSPSPLASIESRQVSNGS